MANYLLPCSCGRVVTVTQSMAGQRVRCSCGSELEVPTLRGLAELERESSSSDARVSRPWTDRQRVAFLLIVLALAAAGVAGFLAVRMPAAPVLVVGEVDEAALQASTPAQINEAFDELKKGIRPQTQIITPEGREALEQRKQMTWGIRILLALGACFLAAGAVATVMRPRGSRGAGETFSTENR